VPTAEATETQSRISRIDWKIDIGHIMTFIVLAIGFAVQYGALSTRVSAIEAQSTRQTAALEALASAVHSLEGTIIRVQTQMDERQRRADAKAR
jgi:uncharacterized coiled-coil protein SlyX